MKSVLAKNVVHGASALDRVTEVFVPPLPRNEFGPAFLALRRLFRAAAMSISVRTVANP